jgi:hypothetical protein
MKKALLIGVIAVMVFGACRQPYSDIKLDSASIAAPSLTVKKAPGGVLITWPPVESAAGYEVWRQPAEGVARQLTTLTRNAGLRFADVNSTSNPLAPEVDYKYTVIAQSTSSGTSSQVVQDSKAETTVKFTAEELPATISLAAVASVTLKETLEGSLIATWAADENPLVSYRVTTNTFNGGSSGNNFTNTSSSTIYYMNTPGYSNVVKVVKVLGDNYSAEAEGSLLISRLSTSAALSISASRDSNTSVKITLPVLAHAELAQYEVSRAKVGFADGQIIEDWAAVTAVSSAWKTSSGYVFYDTAALGDYTWHYRLIVKNPIGENVYGLGYATVNPLATAALQPLSLNWTPNYTYPATPSTTVDDLAAFGYLRYNIEANATYTVYRKQTSGPNNTALPTGTAYDWELVTIAAGDKTTGPDSESVKVTLPQARVQYSFKVVATGTGAKAGYTGTEDTITNVIFSSAIRPNSSSSNALWYNLSGSDYSLIGPQYSGATATANLYRLNLSGLNGYSGSYLRSGESLVIEIRDAGNVNSAYAVRATLSSPAAATYGPSGGTVTTPSGWYFTLPITTPVPTNYAVRLVVNAK